MKTACMNVEVVDSCVLKRHLHKAH
jgi:hypothetical protein